MLDRRRFIGAFTAAAAGVGGVGGMAFVRASRAAANTRAEPQDVSDLLAPIVKKHDLPGMSACLLDQGSVTMLGAAGVRRLGDAAPFTSGDLVHIGSCTKAMTASLCGLLVERGTLRWNMTLEEAFPDFKDRLAAGFRPATLRQLLTHTAGMPGDMGPNGLMGRMCAHRGTMIEGRRMLRDEMLAREPVSPPGTKYLYSNAGYMLAGHIAETLGGGGKPYEDMMREQVFTPCGMASAGFGAPGTPGTLDQPRGHTASGTPVEPGPWGAGDNPLPLAPAGTVRLSISDWAKFVSQHVGTGAEDGKDRPRLLKPETLAELHRPQPGIEPAYACGWLVAERAWAGGKGQPAITHAGSNTMWSAVVWGSPAHHFAMLAAVNHGHDRAMKACDEAVGALLKNRRKAE